MAGVKKLSIALTEELVKDIEAAVASGDYSTASEVVRDALRSWKREREAYIQRLRELVEEGLASGEPVEGGFDAAEIARRGRARLAAKRQAAAE
jgi:antitoxin ParD1/3/4